jgi:hypothetical protein
MDYTVHKVFVIPEVPPLPYVATLTIDATKE